MGKNKKGKSLWTLLTVAALCLFVFSAYNLITLLMAYNAAKSEYSSLGDLARENITESLGVEYQSPIDFKSLKEINGDVIGWLTVPGTVIDYPIVRGETNNTYLRTTFRGESNTAGSIFMDCNNSRDFSDKNTVVYGHKMQNGSMFADLAKYKAQAFYEEHPVFTVYTPETEYRCEIFAAYVTSATSKTYTFGLAGDAAFEEYLDFVLGKSLVSTGVTVAPDDRLIILSTCDYQFSDARMVVHARIVEKSQ